MSSRNQPTPPFNSPYQQALKSNALLHSPTYSVPTRNDVEPSHHPPQGLGLYNYHSNPVLFPPSPQPSESWSHNSHGTSPMIPEPIVDPWTSGAYDHPVSRSPIPWPQYQGSHRSSLSSQREMSVYSAEGSEYGFVQVKLETGSGWSTEEDASPQGTVAPNKLTTTNAFPYPSYGSPSMSSNTTIMGSSYDDRFSEQVPQEGHATDSRGGKTKTIRHNKRRKNRTSPESAKFNCELCGLGFVRLYNKKTHLARHNPERAKDHSCPEEDCNRQFERKADLDRHYKSVHAKLKDHMCPHCGKGFSRSDTLRR